MARGFTWCQYTDDDGGAWAVAVDSDYVSHEGRGWTPIETNALYPLPRTWRPRSVVGLDQSGRRQRAVVSATSSNLWTGLETTFTIRDSEGLPQTCTVIRYDAETRSIPRADPT